MTEKVQWEIPDYLAEFLDDNPESARDLLTTFMDDSNQQLIALDDAFSATNAVTAVKLLHSLRGSSAQIGAMQLSGICEHSERKILAGDLSAAARQIADIRTAHGVVTGLMQKCLCQFGAMPE